MKIELNVKNKSINRSALQVIVLACLLALLAGCGGSSTKGPTTATDSSKKIDSKPKVLSESEIINLLSTGSGLEESPSLSRFLLEDYSSKIEMKAPFSNSGERNFISLPYSCLPVPLLVFYGIFPHDVSGSNVDRKIQKAYGITYAKFGKDSLRLYAIKPTSSSALDTFDSYKEQFSQCSNFRWSLSKRFTESSTHLYQNAYSAINASASNWFTGSLNSEVIFADKNCPDSRCLTDWNSTFVMRRIPGLILFGVINNTAGVDGKNKAPAVSSRDVRELEKFLLNLKKKIVVR